MSKENKSEDGKLERHSILLSVEDIIYGIGSHKKPTIDLRCSFSMSRLGNRTRVINFKGEDKYNLPISIKLNCDSRQLEERKDKTGIGYISYWEPMDSGDGVVKDSEKISGWIIVDTETFSMLLEMSELIGYKTKLSVYVSGLRAESEHIPMGEYWDTSNISNLKIHSFEFYSILRKMDDDINEYDNATSVEEEILSTLTRLNSIIESSTIDSVKDRKREIEYLSSCIDRLDEIIEKGIKLRIFS